MFSVKEKIRKSLYGKTVLAFLCISFVPLAIFSFITFYAAEEGMDAISQDMKELKSLVGATTGDAKENRLRHVEIMKTKTEDSISKVHTLESDEELLLESLYERGLISEEGLEEFRKHRSEINESLQVINYTVGQHATDLNENLELASYLIEEDISGSILSHQERMDRLSLKTTYTLAAFFVLVVVSVLTTSYAVTKSIVGPILRLKEGVDEVSRGNLDYSFTVESEDEIGVLAQEFNKMVAGRKLAEKAVRESEEKFRSLAEQSPNMIFINRKGRVVYANKKCEEIMGFKREEFYSQGFDFHSLIALESRELVKANLGRHTKGEDTPPYEYTLITKEGKRIHAIHTTKLMKYWGENAILGIITDITERKLAEEELEKHREHLKDLVKERTAELQDAQESLLNLVEDLTKAKKDLEQLNIKLQEADRLKSVFLASMSHELRTPLNSIIGFTGIMLQGMAGELNEEQEKQLDMVNSSAKHLLSLINDLLDVSKIEEGKMEAFPEEFYIGEVIDEVASAFALHIQRKELKLEKAVKDGKMYTDKRRFKQVLMNLLSNAVKFTSKGTVRIDAAVEKDAVEVSVKDTGIGIKRGDMPKLFEPFQQIELPPEMVKDGTGLGLYLSRKLVAMLGGEIEVESTYKKGSRFSFSIPARYKRRKEKLSS